MSQFDGMAAVQGHADRYRFTVAKAMHDAAYSPDPVITFLGTCAELMN